MWIPTKGRTREGWGDRRGPEKVVRFGTYNIRSGSNRGVKLSLHGMVQWQVDFGVTQDTKLTYGVYARGSSRFWVMATTAPSAHHGGVAVLYRKAEHFSTEELHLHSPKVIRFHLVTGRQRWNIAGWYIAPSNASDIKDAVSAIMDRPYGAKLLVADYLNANLLYWVWTRHGILVGCTRNMPGLFSVPTNIILVCIGT